MLRRTRRLMLVLVVAVAALPGTASGATTELRRYAYLTDVVPGWATVNWATQTSTAPAWVTYGTPAEGCDVAQRAATGRKIFVGNRAVTQWTATFPVEPDTVL